jgi:hypothetical protein
MQTIEKYINELLLVQDKVVVPNLGVFASQFSPASLNGDVFTPPRKKVDFSIYIREDEKNDDLMKLVMKGENIGFYDFNEKLLAYVQHVQQSIVSHNEYKIEGLGMLMKDTSNKIVFLQNNDVSLLGDSFGLPPIDTNVDENNVFDTPKPLLEEISPQTSYVSDTKITTDAPRKEEERKESRKEQTSNTLEEKPVAHVVSDEVEKPNKGKDMAWWLVTVPMVLLLAFIAYLFISPEAMQGFKSLFASKKEVSADMNGQNTNNTSDADTSRFEEDANDIANKPSEDATTSENTATPIADNSTVKEETKKIEEPKPIDNQANNKTDAKLESGRFYLVYGSFSSEGKANAVSNQLAGKGLTTKVLPLAAKGMYRVVVGDFSSHAAASSKKAELGTDFSQSWVLKAE